MGIFKCCCSECDLVVGDLPYITITGMTGAGWEEIGQCCFKQDFEFDEDQDWDSEYSLDYMDCTEEKNDSFKVIGKPRNNVLPYFTESSPPPDPITDPLFCCNYYEQMGTIQSTYRTRVRRRMFLEWKPGTVTVFISKETLDCLSDPAVEKWIVSLRHSFSYRGRLEQLYYCNIETVWVALDPCFELVPSYFVDHPFPFCDEGSEDWADFVLGTPAGNSRLIEESTTFTLRHKWYNTLPSTITFGDSDVALEACPITCHDLNDVVDEICITVSPLTGTTIDSWGLDVCDIYSESTLADSVNVQIATCPNQAGVSVYPDDPPVDPGDCTIDFVLVSLDIDCPDIFYRVVPYLGYLDIFGGVVPIRQTAACCPDPVNPCGVAESNIYCTDIAFLDHTNKNHFRSGTTGSRSICWSSTVTLDVVP
jgi:hypothetical protein